MTPDQLRRLIDDPDLVARAMAARASGRELADAAALRREHPAEVVAAAFLQAELREKAATKFGAAADSLWLTRAGLEQASSTGTSSHRARRLTASRPRVVLDLCCGIGGDLLALLETSPQAVGVDRDAVTALCATANAELAGHPGRIAVADVHGLKMPADAAVFVDPARRDERGRLGAARTDPELAWCLALASGDRRVTIKAAPGLPVALVPRGWQVEFVAVGRDLKESVLWSPSQVDDPRPLATVLSGGQAHQLTDDGAGLAPVGEVAGHLLDPNPAVGRAGAVDALARRLDATKLDPQIAFLTADRPTPTPLGRWLRVEHHQPLHLQSLRAALRARDIGSVHVRRRGVAGDVATLAKSLRLQGSRTATLVITRLAGQPWALLCVEASGTGEPGAPV